MINTTHNSTISSLKPIAAWRALLHDRGIDDRTIDYFGIVGNQRIRGGYVGWRYPVDAQNGRCRWKNVNGNGPKYLWPDREPEHTFYDLKASLSHHVSRADGVLILAAGEPDVWTLHAADLYNVTCTLAGEGIIPKWFIDALHRAHVRIVRLYPDRDKAGMKHAAKVFAALRDRGIAMEVYALPGKMGSKYDLNDLWKACEFDRDRFVAALEGCDPLDLPEEKSKFPQGTLKIELRSTRFLSGGSSDGYEQWCLHIERLAVQAWHIAPPNGKNLSRLNFFAPPGLRDDGHNPDCQWNYSVHGFKDYANGGEFYSTKQVAELLNEPPFEDWKAQQQPATVPYLCNVSDPKIISAPRHYENGIPHGIRELLNGWHLNPWVHIEGDDVPRLDGLYTYWEVRHDLIYRWQHAQKRLPIAQDRAMWVETELAAIEAAANISLERSCVYDEMHDLQLELSTLRSEIASLKTYLQSPDPEGPLSAHELSTMNRFGLAYKTIRNVEKLGELLQFLFPYIEPLNTGKQTATISAGRPTARYQMPVIDELWDRFFDYFKPQMWRALLIEKYPDLPVDALEFEDVLKAMGATDDDIGVINDVSHDLLAEHDSTLRAALAELEGRISTLYKRYIDAPPPSYMLAPGVTCTNTSQHKDVHLAIRIQREDGEIENRYQAAREGGWTLPAYRAALKRAAVLLDENIVTVPNFIERGTITSEVESVTLACEAVSQNAYMRGRIKLYAPSGDIVTVSPGYAKHFDYDEWLDDNGGRADIHVWDYSVDKLESLETPEEAADREEVSKRQTAINSRRDYEAEAEARAERDSEPGDVAKWVTHQGVMRAELFSISPDSDDVWGEIITNVRADYGQEKQAQTADAEAETGTYILSVDCQTRVGSSIDRSVFHDRDKPPCPTTRFEQVNGRRASENSRELENRRHAQHARTHTPGDISPNGAGVCCVDQQGASADQTDVCNPTGRDTTPHDELTQEGETMPTITAHSAEALEREDDPPPIVIDRPYVLLPEWGNMPVTQHSAVLAERGKSKFNRQKDNSPGIEWAKWSWNPVTGCLHACEYCYARDIAARFYKQGFAPTLHPGRLCAPANTKVPKQAAHDASYKHVFTCSMADLFGKWVPSEWIQAVLNQIRANPQWNFLMLTKFPIRMADFEFPDNAWVGTTVDRQYAVDRVEKAFSQVNAAVKFLSCEPMLEPLQFSSLSMFDWVIIGGASKSTQTPAFKPPLDWVRNLEAQARAAECMIFEKENLGISNRLREFPVLIEPANQFNTIIATAAEPDPDDWTEALELMRELGASYTRGIR